MTPRLSPPLLLAPLIGLAAGNASAIESLSTSELKAHCDLYASEPEGTDAVFCIRYIQGFIDGALATDENVARNALSVSIEDESIRERALRTRMGRYPTYFANFCLGEEVPLKEVVTFVIQDLADREIVDTNQDARQAVYTILRKEYPCRG